MSKVLLEVKTTRTAEETSESMVQILSSLTGVKKQVLYFWRRGLPISFEIAVVNQMVHFFVGVDKKYQSFVEGQILSQYPKTQITPVKDYLHTILTPQKTLSLGQMKLTSSYLYPLRKQKDFGEVDPMGSLLGILAKAPEETRAVVQILLVTTSSSWQKRAYNIAHTKIKNFDGTESANPDAKIIEEKMKAHGFKTAIRIAVNAPSKTQSRQYLSEIANSFASFNNPGGNSLVLRRLYGWQPERMINSLKERSRSFVPNQILNVEEIATFFHFPTLKLSTIKNIAWHKTILSDPPENLPVAEGLTDAEKEEINFFARTEFKNKMTTFGIKTRDRRKHVYVIGKTGTGKSTFIANMAIDDMRKKRGFCVIDPHGDLCEILLNYVPSYRVNDVIYLDPSDAKRTFSLNPLEVTHPGQKELVVSGIVAIFHKLYAHTWGPRLEYILRNALLSVIDLPDATLLMIPEILTNDSFRNKVLSQMNDKVLINFWKNEFDQMPPKLKSEAISPILNKVGQFISSSVIRNIVKNPKSSLDLEMVMNEGKILLLNLSQGKLGEDNAALLGAMTITKLQLAAMNRVNILEEQRRDFYLYVDEFQNFATSSFVKILSEARKYRLDLILANQYIAQIPEEVRAAIFGNAGTMLSFIIGAEDSTYMAREFSERFKEEDLMSLENYQAIIKLSIDGITRAPFHCFTLPLPQSRTQNRDKVIRVSKERYTKETD